MHHLAQLLRYGLKSKLLWILVPIQAGPLKGFRWSLPTGRRFLKGAYHEAETSALLNLIKPGDVVFDIGAHVGYYSLAAAQAVGGGGKVFAFEPLPVNLKALHTHIKANGVDNVIVMPYAVSSETAISRFHSPGGTGRGRLSDNGGITVNAIFLDDLFLAGEIPPPNVVKMDIEGGELSALTGAAKVIEACSPRIFLATHGKEIRSQCEDFLRGKGYNIENFRNSSIIATKSEE